MIRLLFQNIVYPSITLSEIRIELGTGEVTASYFPRLTRLGEFVIGNDDPTDESIMFPGHLSIEFMFPTAETVVNGICLPSVSDAYNQYFTVLEYLQLYDASIYIYKQGQVEPFYQAFFNKEDNGLLKGSNPDRRINLVFLDDYTKMNDAPDINTNGELPVFPGDGNWESLVRLGELIKYMFTASTRSPHPNVVSSVQFLTKFRFKKFLTTAPDTFEYVYLSDDELGCRNWYFYSDDTPTRADQFRRLLSSLASYAIIDFNRTLKILPLWYDGGEIKTIYRGQIEGEDEIEYEKKWDGLWARCGYGGSDDGGRSIALQWEKKEYGFFYWRRITTGRDKYDYKLINEDDIIVKDFLFSVGNNDVGSFGHSKSLRFISKVDGSSRAIKAGGVSYMMANGTWSEEKSLADWASSLTWETLSNKARKFRVVLPGIDYEFGDYFQVEGLNATFRPVLFAYDFENDQTRIVIRENTNSGNYINPTSVTFNKILRAFNYTVSLRKKSGDANFNYTGGDRLSTLPDVPFLSNEDMIVKIKNAYNCLRSTAVEYDGRELSIASHDMKLWLDKWKYVIYIAVGKSKDTPEPASLYPVADDANVTWYLLATINDQQINNTEYQYEAVYTVKNIRTKNPFWIWVGLKSSDADLFPGIRIYNK